MTESRRALLAPTFYGTARQEEMMQAYFLESKSRETQLYLIYTKRRKTQYSIPNATINCQVRLRDVDERTSRSIYEDEDPTACPATTGNPRYQQNMWKRLMLPQHLNFILRPIQFSQLANLNKRKSNFGTRITTLKTWQQCFDASPASRLHLMLPSKPQNTKPLLTEPNRHINIQQQATPSS